MIGSKGGNCPTCWAIPCHQRRRPHVMVDFSHELVDDAKLSHMSQVDAFVCPSCGFVGQAVAFYRDAAGWWDLDTPYDCAPRFCPNCGAKVASE